MVDGLKNTRTDGWTDEHFLLQIRGSTLPKIIHHYPTPFHLGLALSSWAYRKGRTSRTGTALASD